ncbi:hypothetical protein D3C86_792210 [compost metagenome]
MVGRAECDEAVLAIGAELDADRLDLVRVHALDLEVQGLEHGAAGHIENGHGAADFRRGPELRAIGGELDEARALVHQGAVGQGLGAGVDPVQHVGGFAGVDRPLAVRADGHAFGFDADVDLAEYLGGLGVDHRDQRIVFVGDVQPAIVGVQGELLGVFTRGQFLDDLARGHVHHLDPVRVTGADVQQLVVMGQQQAAGALADGQGVGDLQGLQVDQAQAVVLFVGDPGSAGNGMASGEQQGAREQGAAHGGFLVVVMFGSGKAAADLGLVVTQAVHLVERVQKAVLG